MRRDSKSVIVLKWLGMLMGVGGTATAALNLWPLAPVLLVLNCAIWTAVGRAWREPTVWVTNAFGGAVSLVMLINTLLDRAW